MRKVPADTSQNDSAQFQEGDDSNDTGDYPELLAQHGEAAQPVESDGAGETLNVEYIGSKVAEYDEFSHLPWLESMEAVATRGDFSPDRRRNRVGFCGAKLIRRNEIRGSFYEQMSKPLEEPTLLAFDLFDRIGRLKDDYKHHVIRKGWLTWGTRLDDGDILLIEDVIIENSHRRLGLGKKIIRGLLEVTRRKTENESFIAILWPESSKDGHFEDLLASIVGDTGNVHRPKVLDHHDLWQSHGPAPSVSDE